MLSITERAAKVIIEIAKTESLGLPQVRLKVIGGGCAGFSYDLHFESDVNEVDEVFECNGVTLISDPISLQYLEGTEVDYIEGLVESGFRFSNPTSKGSCGCGSSFSV